MQMFGIGLPELMVVLFLAVVVVGPDKLPGMAADLARWIKRTRAYAEHLTKDFGDVVAELEKEVGTSREDWKEIASLVTRHTGDIQSEIRQFTQEASVRQDLEEAKRDTEEGWNNVVPFEAPNKPVTALSDDEPIDGEVEVKPAGEEQPWYVPERTSRRRLRE